jgi:glycerol-3-phosphate dehydrogenase subunit B
MYDVVVIGQGLSGMLSAIWSKEQGHRTALVSSGAGKIIQSTGVIDLIPGSEAELKGWTEQYHLNSKQKSQLTGAVAQFRALTKRLGYPYKGDAEKLISIVTGSGHIKRTALFPETIHPIPEKGHVTIVGFHEVSDFQPLFVKGNLQKARPHLSIDSFKINLGKKSQRTMTQLDAARLLDQKDVRDYCVQQIKEQMAKNKINQTDLYIFPASLGVENWKEVVQQLSTELGAAVTEAPGMPPNATAVRLYERLKKEAVKMGVRFYADTNVRGCNLDGDEIKSLTIESMNQTRELCGSRYILAAGGILGGGLELTPEGIKETVLGLSVDEFGELIHCPVNLHPVGASKGIKVTHYGITGGMYSILSTHEAACVLQQTSIGGTRSA